MNFLASPVHRREHFADHHNRRRADEDRTLIAVHRLEAALSAAAIGREAPWRTDVANTLADLDAATSDEQRNAAEPDSLLADTDAPA